MVTPTRSGDRGQRGIAMLLVIILGAVLTTAWAVAWRGTDDTIRVERTLRLRDQRDGGVAAALTEAVHLLRSGEPPSDPYECIVTVVDGRPVRCKAVYTGITLLEWDVTVTLATAAEIASLPAAPGSF